MNDSVIQIRKFFQGKDKIEYDVYDAYHGIERYGGVIALETVFKCRRIKLNKKKLKHFHDSLINELNDVLVILNTIGDKEAEKYPIISRKVAKDYPSKTFDWKKRFPIDDQRVVYKK